MRHTNDCTSGSATIVRHMGGGFALPGGGRTGSMLEACMAAEGLSKLIDGNAHRVPPAPKVPLTVTRRAVSGPDAERWRTSA
jgi:hypothetical protein